MNETTRVMRGSARRTLLIIEDDRWTRRLLSALFAEEGYRVLQTANGTHGTSLAREQGPDVIVLDLVLADGSGVEVLRDLSAGGREATIPVIVISGAVDDPISLTLMKELERARCVIEKPLDIGRLFDEVRGAAAPRPTLPSTAVSSSAEYVPAVL